MNADGCSGPGGRSGRPEAARLRAAADEFRRRYGFGLVFCDAEGRRLRGRPTCRSCGAQPECARSRRGAIREALRWGEPSPSVCPFGYIHWAVPVTDNNRLVGGLVVAGVPADAGPRASPGRLRAAAEGLRRIAEHFNLTNAAWLQARRADAGRERERAEAIHAVKTAAGDGVRDAYVREEPALMAAIRSGDRAEARRIANRVLTAVYHAGGGRLDLLKSFALELVVMMFRAAVEAGGDPTELLGARYRSVTALAAIRDEEALCAWLTSMLDRLMDALRARAPDPITAPLLRALDHIERNLHRDVARAEAARAAGVSPGHLSHLLKASTGERFSQTLRRLRIERARSLLARTDDKLSAIAESCGFCDASHFGRAFRRATGATPAAWRAERKG
jgi:AraC-like DNA-binding protein